MSTQSWDTCNHNYYKITFKFDTSIQGSGIENFVPVHCDMNDENCSYHFSNCSDINAIKDVKLAFACLGVLTSMVAAGTLIPKCCLLVYKIVFYAIIANGLHVAVRMVAFSPIDSETDTNIDTTLHIRDGTDWSTFCGVY